MPPCLAGPTKESSPLDLQSVSFSTKAFLIMRKVLPHLSRTDKSVNIAPSDGTHFCRQDFFKRRITVVFFQYQSFRQNKKKNSHRLKIRNKSNLKVEEKCTILKINKTPCKQTVTVFLALMNPFSFVDY